MGAPMALLQALVYGFATTFKVRDLARCFTGARLRPAKTQIVAEYGDDRVAVGFDFGAVAFINVPAEERTRVIESTVRSVPTAEPHAPLEEDFLVDIQPGATPTVHFDRVVVPKLDAAMTDIIALLLAQSVSIDYYDEDLAEILHALDQRTDRIARTARLFGSPRELTRFVGAATSP